MSVVLGSAYIIIGAVALFILAVVLRTRLRRTFRTIPAMLRLRRAIGLSVEDGKRVHVSLGQANLVTPSAAASLAGLSTLERIASQSLISDRPPVATSGDAGISILSQDTLRLAYRNGNTPELYDPDQGRLGGLTPLSYIAGTLPVIRDEEISTNLLIGSFGPEVLLLSEAADQQRAFVLAASDSLPAQAVLYASAQEPLIGEELFAVPAFLQSGPAHLASLQVQDILRWLLILFILIGVILQLVGVSVL
jgi:hypothetical protein